MADDCRFDCNTPGLTAGVCGKADSPNGSVLGKKYSSCKLKLSNKV